MAALLAVQIDIDPRRAMRRERVFRDRVHPLEIYNDLQLYQRYRLDRQTILDLADIIRIDLEPRTFRNHALPTELKLLAALRFYATGSFQQVTGDTVHISQPSLCRIISQVNNALLPLMGRAVKFPSPENIQDIGADFYGIANFPGVMGVIDGTHVWILGPTQHEWRYVNRKNYYSINTQVVMDAQCRFINIVAKWPGSTHDSVILRESALAKRMETRMGEEVLLGDSGYPVRPWLMTPFLNPTTAIQRRYNRAHKRTRCLVERGIGQWKRRFHCLHGQLRYSPQKACEIIGTCAILHNIAINRGLPNFDEEPIDYNHNQMMTMKRMWLYSRTDALGWKFGIK
uniref:putative nuclease HARBI1 n=1 Tax=Myxine glutinosa TaxID=7769 RepID=UPI00358FC806